MTRQPLVEATPENLLARHNARFNREVAKKLSAWGATKQQEGIYHTKNESIADACQRVGLHVQGVTGFYGYSAYIWLKGYEPKS